MDLKPQVKKILIIMIGIMTILQAIIVLIVRETLGGYRLDLGYN